MWRLGLGFLVSLFCLPKDIARVAFVFVIEITFRASTRVFLKHTDHRSFGYIPCGRTCPPRFKSSTSHGCSHYAFNGRRCPRRQLDANGDFVNLEICCLSSLEVLTGVGFAYVYS
jgi:hypothetical protein